MKNVLLVVLDGWGHSDPSSPPEPGDSLALARIPHFRSLYEGCPRVRLACSGLDVGLPDGFMGNSEVGHLNLGAGRIVPQDLVRIDEAVSDGSLARALELDRVKARLTARGGTLHLVCLVSDAGVHSHVRHLEAVIELLPDDVPVMVHAITDGRDASPTGSLALLEAIDAACRTRPNIGLATVLGRYWAMDRDRRWDRTGRALDAIAHGVGRTGTGSAPEVLRASYGAGVTDEFVEPTVLCPGNGSDPGSPYGGIGPEDTVMLLNYRADRMRQLTGLLCPGGPDFAEAGRSADEGVIPALATFPAEVITMTEYRPDFPVRVAFPPRMVQDCLGEVIGRAGLRQLRVGETEKYAHITYFFNGGREEPFGGEDRHLVPSPKVATYDLCPEMSAREVAAAASLGINGTSPKAGGGYAFVLVNFANADVVGHTGSIPASVRAVEEVDACLGELLGCVRETPGWVALITADHGNCERMIAEDGSPHTAHTAEPVDLIVFDPSDRGSPDPPGPDVGPYRLADVAPTVLSYLGVKPPPTMTGRSLVSE